VENTPAKISSSHEEGDEGGDIESLSEEALAKMKLKERRKSLRKSITPADEALLRLSRAPPLLLSGEVSSSSVIGKDSSPPLPPSFLPSATLPPLPPHSVKVLSSLIDVAPSREEGEETCSESTGEEELPLVATSIDGESAKEGEDGEEDEDEDDYSSDEGEHHAASLQRLVPFHALQQSNALSLKDLHRNSLLEAYLSLAQPVSSSSSPSDSHAEMDTSTTADTPLATTTVSLLSSAADQTILLSFERFLSWEQISSVIEEGILSEDLIREKFQEIIHARHHSSTAREGKSFEDPFSRSSQQQEEGEDGGILFDDFCVLMEKLEYLVSEKEEERDEEGGEGGDVLKDLRGKVGLASVREGEEDDSSSSDDEEGPQRGMNIIRRRKQSVRLIEL
jgi:hypothetical protein